MAQHELAGPPARNGNALAPYRASAGSSASPSMLIGRIFVVLLAAPWLFELLRTALQSEKMSNSWPSLFWIALALFTFAGVTVASGLIRRARRYETTCEGERLLFSKARDAMLLVGVRRNSHNLEAPFTFVIKAENPAAVERLSAFGQETAHIGRSIDEVFPDWLKEKIHLEYTACAMAREIRRYVIRPPDGTLTHESIATPVLDSAGMHVTHIIVIMRDITERIQHERELAEALRRAEMASQSKSKFLASMSHELRTPLNAVLGYSEMMQLGIGGMLSDKHKEYAQYVHESGSHLLNIIGDILDLSKIDAGQFALNDEETQITPLIDTCILMVKERALARDYGFTRRFRCACLCCGSIRFA